MSDTGRRRDAEENQSSWDQLIAEELGSLIKSEIGYALEPEQIQSILDAPLLQGNEIVNKLTTPLIRGKTLFCEHPASFEELKDCFFFLSEERMLIQQVFVEVPEWSLENFGDQKGLGYLAPLLGILEEVGELTEVLEMEKPKKPENSLMDEINDAVGDIGIYSIDFLSRVGVNVIDVWPFSVEQLPHSPIVYLSQVNHACLKRHQGIRGFDNNQKFFSHVLDGMRKFLGKINSHYKLTENTITTWQRVRERNWKKNPQGQGV